MHEYAAVDELIDNLTGQLARQGVRRVTTIHLRRGSAFDPAALEQAYALLSAGTPLEGARLLVSVEDLDFACPCGHRQVITSDDLIGHLFVCPACGAAREIANTHDLAVVGVYVEAGAGEQVPAAGAG